MGSPVSNDPPFSSLGVIKDSDPCPEPVPDPGPVPLEDELKESSWLFFNSFMRSSICLPPFLRDKAFPEDEDEEEWCPAESCGISSITQVHQSRQADGMM